MHNSYNRVYQAVAGALTPLTEPVPSSWRWGYQTLSTALPLIITVTLGVILALFSSVTAPLILAHRTEKMHREDREAEYARQDEIARATATKAALATQATNSRLDIIHALVNSGLTSVMKSELAAVQRELELLCEVAELHRADGREPTPEMMASIQATEKKVADLTRTIADRDAAEQASVEQHGKYPRPDSPVPPEQNPESSAK